MLMSAEMKSMLPDKKETWYVVNRNKRNILL